MISRKYTTKIEIWQPTEVPDGFGGYLPTDTMVKRPWAAVKTSGAGYKFQQFGLNDFKNPVVFSIRGKNNFTFNKDTFIIYKGKRFEIKGIDNMDLEGLELVVYADAT